MSLDTVHQLRQRIEMYFDNELPKEDCKQLLSRVQQDPKCNKLFNKEKNFREYIRTNVKRPSVSADLIQSIRDRIRIV